MAGPWLEILSGGGVGDCLQKYNIVLYDATTCRESAFHKSAFSNLPLLCFYRFCYKNDKTTLFFTLVHTPFHKNKFYNNTEAQNC